MKLTRQKSKTNHNLYRFLSVLFVLFAYAGLTIHQYGVALGLSVTGLTWAFFVFATPVADAGFLLAFPIRLITGLKMLYTQIGAWLFGILLVAYFLLFDTATFDKTALLQLFHTILVTPWPLWLILILSGFGTYVNILFDDDVFDVAKAKNKKTLFTTNRGQLYTTIIIFATTLMLYALLLHFTHTHIKLF